MTNNKVPKITDLSEEDRKLALKQTEGLLHMLKQYPSGKTIFRS
jgi:hypothetical protein